jgi:hypothetical protein
MTAVGSINAGGRILASAMQGIAPLAVIKGADQDQANNVTLTNDDALYLYVAANATYLFECYLCYEGGTQGASDLAWAWSVPSGASMRYQAVYYNTSGVTQANSSEAGTVQIAGTNLSALRGVTMTGSLITSTVAGNLQLQWCQEANVSTPTIVHAQSTLALWRVT